MYPHYILQYIDQSNIQTFDAFSLYLVKKYHYLLGIPKTIDIGDSSLFILERKRIIDEQKVYDINKILEKAKYA